ncbi:archaetidylserine decarboxylase [uncultured Umboniibacter sp.]|uniref:archaetidylserine decarboxylase n=1 Tax=uncultured Umboniibacter sp. TaxID=1798917 RepID=UPI00261E844A|nr:archaetidylserine decarboxylase [uncultured Umboniibacter sp.]
MSTKFSDQLFVALQHVLPQHTLSRIVGRLAASETPWIKDAFIRNFAKKFDIDMSDAQEHDLTAFASFNDFFTRALKSEARPIDANVNTLVSPADGVVSECGTIENGQLMQAKGQYFSLHSLLGAQPELTDTFANGSFATIYLSPRDYHRVHMPFGGTLRKAIYVPGDLFSVNGVTAQLVPGLFSRNERLVCVFDTPKGPVALILVGAMIVAGIETVWGGQVCPLSKDIVVSQFDKAGRSPSVKLNKGAEMGRFKLGSTAIVVTPKDASEWIDGLSAGSAVRMGEAIGEFKDSEKETSKA